MKSLALINLLSLFTLYVKKVVTILLSDGFARLIYKIENTVKHYYYQKRLYPKWIKENEPSKKELEGQRHLEVRRKPIISIIVPTFNTPKVFLVEMLESVLHQTYPHWELCVADGASHDAEITEILRLYAAKEQRIKIKFLDENKGIAGNSNEAISLATGEFISFLDHDDTLSPFALFEVVQAINENPDVDFIYSDEDILSEDGTRRMEPQFKPDWSPDMLRSCNYICHLTVMTKRLLETAGFFREGYDGSQDHDLILRATERAGRIVHIAKVLYHWRTHASSAAMNMTNKLYAFESGKKALADHLHRTKLRGTVADGLFLGSYKLQYSYGDEPLVSIIIPNKNHADDLQRCVNSIIQKSTYKNYEILIIDNDSSEAKLEGLYQQFQKHRFVKILKWNGPFNYSAVNNFAAGNSKGDILLFLNNDTEVINSDWLQRLLDHAMRPNIGAVGPKLLYPDNTVQHGGIILGLWGLMGHAHRHFPGDAHGFMGRLKIVHNVSAVTGACLMTRRCVFEEVNGFDEGYPLTFSDLDYCLKLREKGYLNVWTPYAQLYHDEFKTRGSDDTRDKQLRYRKEMELYRRKWKHMTDKGDPYYNINLTLERDDFSIRV